MDKPKVVIVGTIGHCDHIKEILAAALLMACFDVNEQPELPCIEIEQCPELPERIFCGELHKKSKGDKRRDRAERRSKGWK